MFVIQQLHFMARLKVTLDGVFQDLQQEQGRVPAPPSLTVDTGSTSVKTFS